MVSTVMFTPELVVRLVDGTVHGDGYITPIVTVSKLCKWFIYAIVELTNHSLQNHVT